MNKSHVNIITKPLYLLEYLLIIYKNSQLVFVTDLSINRETYIKQSLSGKVHGCFIQIQY
jgi:hypothetical protein